MTSDGSPSTREPFRVARRTTALSALVGVLALAAAMAAAELVAGFTGPATVPVVAVGTAVIPLTPEKVKEQAIGLFGTSDKTALIIGTCIVVTIVAAVAGIIGRRHATTGNAIVILLGGAGALAAATRPTAAMLDVAPSIVAAVVGVLVLQLLLRRVPVTARGSREIAGAPGPVRVPATGGGRAPRRGFLAAAAGFAAAAAASGGIGSVLVKRRYDKAAARAQIVLPRPASAATGQPPGAQISTVPDTPPAPTATSGVTAVPGVSGSPTAPGPPAPSATAVSPSAPPGGTAPTAPTGSASTASTASKVSTASTASVPAATASPQAAGTQVSVKGVSPFFTSNDDFYRIDTSLLIPELQAQTWSLRVHGMVAREIHLTYAQLLTLPLIERDITLSCVSNDVGGGLISNARWLGALIRPLLLQAGISAGAEQLVSTDVHGMTIGTPVKAVMDGRDAILAVGMNGTTLPFEHGFPVRMVVPGLYGYVSACKWIVDIEVTTWKAYDAYWVQRGWAQQGPIRTESRIDIPRSSVRAGLVPVAGVAWAPHVGIAKVEVRVDDGPWEQAMLAPVATDDTWREWVYPWLAAAGNHRLQVRATDMSGALQTPSQAQPFPSGATGWHTVSISAS